MKDPIQVDWRQYPIGTPAVFRSCEPARKLKLIHKFADNDVLFGCDETTLIFRRLFTGRVSDCEAFKADNDILLPWSHAIAEGYNPDKVTNEQVGEGYRLLDVKCEPFDDNAECWSNTSYWYKSNNKVGYNSFNTYRLPIKPKLSAKDFPPGTVVRFAGQDEHSWQSVIRVTQHEFHLANSSILAFDKSLSMATSMYDVAMQRSLDGGKTWLSC